MDFKKIYDQWTHTHNERVMIEKSSKQRDEISETENKRKFESIGKIRKISVQDQLDLHGVRLDQALTDVSLFIDSCYQRGLRKIRIITGKGIHSPGGIGVLKPEVLSIIKNHKAVREVDTNPKAKDGGSGAIIVILKSEY